MKILRILAIGVAILLVGAAAAAFYLLHGEAVPEHSDYTIDREGLRAAAHALPGDLPVRIDHVEIAEVTVPHAAVFSGFDFSPHTMAHGAYQVVYPDGSYALIDAGFGPKVFAKMAERGGGIYHGSAFRELAHALPGARLVVMTHEHSDHIEGLAHVDPAAFDELAAHVFLNTAQYENPQTRTLLPSALLKAIQPVAYQGAHAVAPGISVFPAPGHTPGSQLVYVELAGGHGFLFIGDVAWHMDQLRQLRYRPRLVTDFMLGENRAEVLAEFRTLHGMLDDPSMLVVCSHDLDQLKRLQDEGLIGRGLELPNPIDVDIHVD